MRLDEVVTGRVDFRAVIDGIAAVALELINALLGRSSGTVDLTLSTPALRSGRRRPGRQAGSPTNLKDSKPVRRRRGNTPRPQFAAPRNKTSRVLRRRPPKWSPSRKASRAARMLPCPKAMSGILRRAAGFLTSTRSRTTLKIAQKRSLKLFALTMTPPAPWPAAVAGFYETDITEILDRE